jgi:hypothetical protein
MTTGMQVLYRYLVKNEAGWSDPSDVMQTYVGTEPGAPSGITT